jgi:hypothetical protein
VLPTLGKKPKASRPNMPGYGINESRKQLLRWKWAEGVLSKTRNYFLATVRTEGRPHVMPIWGVWINATFYFSAGEHSVKARNLQSNPNCIFCPGDAGEAVILEGVAERLADKKLQARVAKVYFQKYEWDLSELNQFIFAIRPKTAFGQIEKTFTQTATRWTFGGPSKHGAL